MKALEIQEATLSECLRAAKKDRVVLTRNQKPVALLVSVAGMDWEQLELSTSEKFWQFIEARRKEKTVSHAEMVRRFGDKQSTKKRLAKTG